MKYILGLVILVGIWVISIYNRLVTLRNRAKEAIADIDVQSKRRTDLIPNLVETVKGYATHEKTLLENITAARSAVATGGSALQRSGAEDTLSGTLKSLFAVAENYPQLKANENFAKLQDELSDTENKMMAARRFYNSTVRDLNTALEHFPENIVAPRFGFSKMEFFAAEEGDKAVPQVKF